LSDSRILMGVVGRPHGVRGLVHVTSYTEDPAALAHYFPLFDEQGRKWRLAWRAEVQQNAGVAELIDAGGARVADRSQAEKLTNLRLYVARDALPEPEDDEFYLADLVGLGVRLADGAMLGKVLQVHDYGAGASLEIGGVDGGSRLVPFTRAAVPVIDMAARIIEIVPPEELVADRDGEEAP